jgi:hypothetical protein
MIHRPARRRTARVGDVTDAEMGRAVKLGFLVGTPIVFCITVGIGLDAATGFGVAALIGTWSGLMNGWYLGGFFLILCRANPWNTPNIGIHKTTAIAHVTTAVDHDLRGPVVRDCGERSELSCRGERNRVGLRMTEVTSVWSVS